MFSAAVSWSNFFSSVATRVASRDFMASWEDESWTTLQITVPSSSFEGIFFATVEVFSPLTATLIKMATEMDRSKSHSTVERILSQASVRLQNGCSGKSLWLHVSFVCMFTKGYFRRNTKFSPADYFHQSHFYTLLFISHLMAFDNMPNSGLHYILQKKTGLVHMNIFNFFMLFKSYETPISSTLDFVMKNNLEIAPYGVFYLHQTITMV